jgi:hypothetical protein
MAHERIISAPIVDNSASAGNPNLLAAFGESLRWVRSSANQHFWHLMLLKSRRFAL